MTMTTIVMNYDLYHSDVESHNESRKTLKAFKFCLNTVTVVSLYVIIQYDFWRTTPFILISLKF